MKRPFHLVERISLLEHTHANFENTRLLNDFDLSIWLMSQEDSSCSIKIAQYLQKAFNKREKELQAQLKFEEVK